MSTERQKPQFGASVSLWRASQTSLNFASSQAIFLREERFKLQSIYWPEQSHTAPAASRRRRSLLQQTAEKVSRKIDEELKNEQRIRIKKQGHSQVQQLHTTPASFRLAQRPAAVTQRLYTTGIKVSRLRDRFGNRCSLLQNEEPQIVNGGIGTMGTMGTMGNSIGNIGNISTMGNSIGTIGTMGKTMGSNRTNVFRDRVQLDLPLNYHPGPGAYDLPRYLER